MKPEQWVPPGRWYVNAAYIDEIEWSGVSCIFICGECGYQGGATWTIEDTKAELVTHRSAMHTNTRHKRTAIRSCRTCTRGVPAKSHGLCGSCIGKYKKVKELEDA